MKSILVLLLSGCTDSNPKDMGVLDGPPGSHDTGASDTDIHDTAETDTQDSAGETDSDSGEDTDTEPDECENAADLCGMNLDSEIELRGIGWGSGIPTQNRSAYAWSDPEEVAAGIYAGYYPPVPDFPDVTTYPEAYNDATWYLNNWYGWGWCCSVLDWAAEYHSPTYITVHHTAGRFDDTVEYVEFVYNFHTFGEGHGWGDIGYQRLVGRDDDDDEIHHFEGRWSGDDSTLRDPWGSLWVVGAHVSGYNTDNAGISTIGDFSTTAPDSETLEALKAHVARSAYEIGLTDTSQIVGHRDWGSGTECPGEELYNLLPEIREHVEWCQEACGYAPPSHFAPMGVTVTRSSREQFGD